jgi:integrative and conjugative element protein (TIGR02256 family)
MTSPSLHYDLPKRALGPDAKLLIFSTNVVGIFFAERQMKASQSESGGQLFGEFTGDVVRVVVATTPTPQDIRRRFLFTRLHATEQGEIDHEYSTGLHYLGDWHTHPENKPTPSHTDLTCAKRLFRTSKHQLPNFLMVIVGTSNNLADLYVALVNGRRIQQL